MPNSEVEILKDKVRRLKNSNVLVLDKRAEKLVFAMNHEATSFKLGRIKKRKIAIFHFGGKY